MKPFLLYRFIIGNEWNRFIRISWDHFPTGTEICLVGDDIVWNALRPGVSFSRRLGEVPGIMKSLPPIAQSVSFVI
jgi:hypothetical protein